MHPNGGVLDSLLAFEDQVDWTSQEADKGVPFGRGEKDLAEFQPQDFAHGVKRGLQLSSAVPVGILVATGSLLALSFPPPSDRRSRGLLRSLDLDTRDRPLQQETIYLEKLFVVG